MKTKQLALKAYVRPEAKIVKIETLSVLATSDPTFVVPDMEWGTQEKDYEESVLVSDLTEIL